MIEGNCEFGVWWTRICRLKSIAQWRVKVETLGFPDHSLRNANAWAIGVLLYRHLTAEGRYNAETLQEAPAVS